MTFKHGSRGTEVKQLQATLVALGYALATDGVYGTSTANAVRAFQIQRGLVPDGIAGDKTLSALSANTRIPSIHALANVPPSPDRIRDLMNVIGSFIVPIAVARTRAPLRSDPLRPASAWSMSVSGLQFIYSHETLAGVSNRLHWPRGASGVTLGPGYDMKERSATTIESDMLSLGLESKVAQEISLAASLKNEEAQEFAKHHKSLVDLTRAQEVRLLSIIIEQYERLVRNLVSIGIYQHQYDALTSFAYNPGGRLRRVADHLNGGRIAAAMQEMQRAVTSGGIVMRGLSLRRQHEVTLYLYGRYA